MSADFPFGPLQEGTGARRAGGHPAGQGGWRRHGQARRLPPISRNGARRHPRRYPGVRAVRHHPADRIEIRRAYARDRARHTGHLGNDGQARAEAKVLEDSARLPA